MSNRKGAFDMRVFLILTLLALPVHAAEWQLDPARSTITFTYTENDVPFEGHFPDISGRAFFDPTAPEEGSDVEVTVVTETVVLQDFVRTAFAKTEDWFHTQAHPQATFTLNALKVIDGPKMQADGILTIKGNAFAFTPDFTLEQTGTCLRATGQMEMAFKEFGIGQGGVSRLISVGDTVILNYDLIGHLADLPPDC
jgi:polyisoprenoid-binding protein YceI